MSMPQVPAMTHFSVTELTQLNRNAFRPRVRTVIEHRLPGHVLLPRSPDHLVRVCVEQYSGSCGRDSFSYSRGQVDILPAGATEEWEEWTASTTLALSLPQALLDEAAGQAGLGAGRTGLEPRFQLRDPQIEHVAWALDAEQQAGNPHGAIYTELLGMALAVRLAGAYRAPARPGGGLAGHALRKVVDYIEAHLDRELSLSVLAALAGMSSSHFGAQFRKSTGMAVHEYVIRRRIERARELLRDSSLPVSQVALAAGFSHQSHLARWMRRLLGVTPGELRRTRRPD